MREAESQTLDGAVTLTPQAVERVKQVIAEFGLPADAGLRVATVPGGCSGLNYEVKVVEGPQRGDEHQSCDGVKVYLPLASKPHVAGMTIDWVSTMVESRFVYHNPNATGGCGCGESFSVD